MINCLLVDDEPIARKILAKYVAKTPGLSVIGQLDNALDVADFLINNEVDLIFLDINMPDLTGIELLRSLLNPPNVIITTAHSKHGAESYEYNVIDYLLKPIPFERFLKAIQKVQKTESKKEAESGIHYIFLKETQTIHKILIKNIRYVEAYGNYIKVYTLDNMLLVRSTLQSILNASNDALFQIHKSYLVSKDFIKSIDKDYLLLDKNEKLPVSNSFRKNLLSQISDQK